MYPNRLLADTDSAAERKLYELFRDQVSDQFTVFHRVPFLARGADARAYDGEADFVAAHPDLGLLIIEVKGGRIRCDGATGQWVSIDRYDQPHILARSPFEQARNARYNLVRKLRGTHATSPYAYPACHAVCFPDITVAQDMGLDAPAAIVVDQRGLAQLEQSIRTIYAYWQSAQAQLGPGVQGIKALVNLVAPSFELRPQLSRQVADEAAAIKLLTEQQFRTLNLLSRQRRALILGCAGSGKTMLALEKARRLAEEGYAVLLTCYNARLAEWLAASPHRHDGVTVKHFHRLCSELARQAKIPIPPLNSEVVQGDEEYFFGTVLPDAMLQAVERLGPQYNAIIADEGQDFYAGWWIALEALLNDPTNDVFYIFADDNQNIYAGQDQTYPFREPTITLDTNCRNTQLIHKAVTQFYRGSVPIQCMGPQGRAPERIEIPPGGNLLDELRKRLYTLVQNEQLATQDIIVLTPRAQTHSQLRAGTRLGNLILAWAAPTASGQIECATIHSFKGMERAVVILAELDQLPPSEREALLYIGVSRAIHHLIVLGSFDR